jgi:predicted nucleic acid-binding protein
MENSFVVDNSVVMSWCFKGQANAYADTVLDSLKAATACVPSVWPLEVVNVLLAAEHANLISEADSVRFINLLSGLPIFIQHESPERSMTDLLGLARAHELSSYDASYLDLAMKKGHPLATLDQKLRKAAVAVKLPIFSG